MLLLVDLLPAQNQRSVSCICFNLTLLKWQNDVKVDLKHFNLVKKVFCLPVQIGAVKSLR